MRKPGISFLSCTVYSYLIERPCVSLKYFNQNLFSRRNDFSNKAKHYWKYLLFQFSYFFSGRHFCCSFLFLGNLWKMSNTTDLDFIAEYIHPFSSYSLSVSRETQTSKNNKKDGIFFIGNSAEKQSKIRGRKWSPASVQCPKVQVLPVRLLFPWKKIEENKGCPESSVRTYLNGSNNDTIYFSHENSA